MGPAEELSDKQALLLSELKAINDYLEAHKAEVSPAGCMLNVIFQTKGDVGRGGFETMREGLRRCTGLPNLIILCTRSMLQQCKNCFLFISTFRHGNW